MLSTLQSLLNGLSNAIKKLFVLAIEESEAHIWRSNEEEAFFSLELCKIYLLHYENITKSTNYLNRSMDLLGLEHSLIGKLF